MKRSVTLILLPVIGLYILLFQAQEGAFFNLRHQLRPVPSSAFLQAASGYLRQLTAEMIFVQSSVFLGGQHFNVNPESYAPVLAHNYVQITTLYPRFNDPYYYAQSFLPEVSPEMAEEANRILTNGRKAYPENIIYPFFQAFNHFSYQNEPLKAAAIFREASLLPDAPSMFMHLAVILSAEGGELEAGLLSLQALQRGSSDPVVRQRYSEEIAMFNQAIAVQQAASTFALRNQRYPATLDELVPDYIPALPNFGTAFHLTWKPPNVGMKRPSPQEMRKHRELNNEPVIEEEH